MALRVLLADENVTIKKVIQLSLQDYDVTVKSVNLGIDVLDVARSFQPDVVFADVLLQKRNGYEVCVDFKQDAELSKTPFVLMWSGFMELDSSRFSECGADGDIEKPFDKDTIRSLVQKLVSKTQTNELAQFTTPPETAAIVQEAKLNEQPPAASPSSDVHDIEEVAEVIKPMQEEKAPTSDAWSMESFDGIEDFVQKPLSAVENDTSSATPNDDDVPVIDLGPDLLSTPSDEGEEWVQKSQPNLTEMPQEQPLDTAAIETASANADQWSPQDLSEFKVEIPDENDDGGTDPDVEVDFSLTEQPVEKDFAVHAPHQAEVTPAFKEASHPSPESEEAEFIQPIKPLSEKQLEDVLKAQSKDVIESVVWKIVPDLAEKIIREKIETLMKEMESR